MRSFLKFVGISVFLLLGVTQITYSQDLIKVGEVTNEIRLGPFAGNRNMVLGVKNILEELLMDLDYDLSPNAEKKINIR